MGEGFPNAGRWCFCYGCQTFWGAGIEALRENNSLSWCSICSRPAVLLYLCHECHTLSLFPSFVANRDGVVLSETGAPAQNCPGCSSRPRLPIQAHHCEAVEVELFTSRADCPYCGLSSRSGFSTSDPELDFGRGGLLKRVAADQARKKKIWDSPHVLIAGAFGILAILVGATFWWHRPTRSLRSTRPEPGAAVASTTPAPAQSSSPIPPPAPPHLSVDQVKPSRPAAAESAPQHSAQWAAPREASPRPSGFKIASQGTASWSGVLAEKSRVDLGSQLPGVPVIILGVEPKERLRIVELPNSSNGWRRLVVESNQQVETGVTVHWRLW
ncbi:MAG TPA: hypothetical protein VJ302_36520 [Blastocatellia bacterium]|nr:hypothetical protein [Blastocatellia bacterium]